MKPQIAAATLAAQVGVPIWSQTTLTCSFSRISRSMVSTKFRPAAAYTQAVRKTMPAPPPFNTWRSPPSLLTP